MTLSVVENVKTRSTTSKPPTKEKILMIIEPLRRYVWRYVLNTSCATLTTSKPKKVMGPTNAVAIEIKIAINTRSFLSLHHSQFQG